MFIYTQTKFTSNVFGGRVVKVQCEKCACEYYFELRRVGTGVGVAPYSIGKASAKDAAQEKAVKDLAHRLKGEAELVPCPQCHWINDELVVAYRKNSYRGYSTFAIIAGVVGILMGLVAAKFIASGPAADRAALPYLLIYWPIFIVMVVGSVILSVALLRRRIQPNSQFPMVPNIPFGTPKALIIDRASGELVAADRNDCAAVTEFEFHVGKHGIPHECCVCLGPADLKQFVALNAFGTTIIPIPRCSGCSAVAAKHRWFVGSLVFLILAVLLAVVFVPLIMKFQEFEFYFSIFSGILFAIIFGCFAAAFSDRVAWVKRSDSSRGIAVLEFKNSEYAARLAAANQSNVSRA